jgi:hypothetical protein
MPASAIDGTRIAAFSLISTNRSWSGGSRRPLKSAGIRSYDDGDAVHGRESRY